MEWYKEGYDLPDKETYNENNNMKTVLVVYTKSKEADVDNTKHLKRYAFNAPEEIQVEDLLEPDRYNSFLLVVQVMAGEPYTHYNPKTGEMSHEEESEDFFEIREVDIVDELDPTVHCKLIK